MNSTIQELENKQRELEAKVQLLVGKLEATKKHEEIRVPPDMIIKSKEEQEASMALEKLAISEEQQKQASTTKQAATGAPAAETKPKVGKKGGSKDQAPERAIDISRLDLRIGKILEVKRHPDADALYVEKIDCGDPTGPRTVISGLVNHVPIEEMQDRLVVVLCNLKPVKMRGILSEAMVMCASTPEKVEILSTPSNVQPGDRVIVDNYVGEPDAQLNPKKKIWEQVAPSIKTNDEGIATYEGSEFKVANRELVGKFKSSLKNVNIR